MTRGISISPDPNSSEVNEKEDENNNINDTVIPEDYDVLTLYVRAGCDNRKYGACPFCQRIFMLLMLKQAQGGKNKPDFQSSDTNC